MKTKLTFPLMMALTMSLALSACQTTVPAGTPAAVKAGNSSQKPDISNISKSGDAAAAPSLGFVSPLGALPANSVMLIGSNLGSATAVTFNGTAVTFTASGDNQLTVTLPSASNEGVFVVTTPNGTATLNNGPPAITALSVSSGTVGSTVTLTGSGFSGASAVSFNGTAASFTVASDSSITATVPGGASDGTLSVTTAKGSGTSTASFDVTNKVLFVKAGNVIPAATGSDWNMAFADLQQALSMAAAGDEIWVAKGTYKPSASSNRDAAFSLVANVKVYGGFGGSEKDLSARNWQTNTTILSGDLANNDVYTDDSISNNEENSYHVVKGANNATLDGFTVQGGCANFGNDVHLGGAGLLIKSVSPTLRNLIIAFNSAVSAAGGAMVQDSSASFYNVVFHHNTARDYGGGLYISMGSPSLEKVIFYKNSVTRNESWVSGGGASVVSSAALTMKNAIFANNSSSRKGGGLFLEAVTSNISNTTFANNTASLGGGLNAQVNSSSQVLKNLLFWNSVLNSGADLNISGSVTASTDPFVNSSDPDGPDNLWLTSDDGLQLTASATEVINQGISTDINTDILGNPRVGTPDPGAYEKQ